MQLRQANSRLTASPPPKSRRFFQFSLAAILLLMVPLGVAFNWLREYLDDGPINWIPYSADALEQTLPDKFV